MKKHVFFFLIAVAALTARVASAAADPYIKGSQRAIGDEDLEPKDPILATTFSVLPGVVFHGFGSYYAGDYEWGNKMLVMEIMGGGLALWGHNVIHQASNWDPYFGGADNSRQAGYWIKAAGVLLIVGSWVGDVANASEAAESWNRDHSMQFQLDSYDGTGARLQLASRF